MKAITQYILGCAAVNILWVVFCTYSSISVGASIAGGFILAISSVALVVVEALTDKS